MGVARELNMDFAVPYTATLSTPRTLRQAAKQGGPPQALISQLATRFDRYDLVGGGTPTVPWADTEFIDCATVGTTDTFGVGFGVGDCRKQIDQAEEAVARCKNAVAMAKSTVMSVSLA